MNIADKISYVSKFTFNVLLKKAINSVLQKFKTTKYKKELLVTDKRSSSTFLISKNLLPIRGIEQTNLSKMSQKWIQHTFDVLGSGPIKNSYQCVSNGFEDSLYQGNISDLEIDEHGNWLSNVVSVIHLTLSKSIWKSILQINPSYVPIDWQLDIKSGFRWGAKQWFKAQGSFSKNKFGVDIKVPWELSRLQHLPVLILIAKTQSKAERDKTITEVICQILDFVMANPIGMGVNFSCPMDIGIRNANILTTLNWLKEIDESRILATEQESIINHYIANSTEHILKNLEYREGLTSNHYLGNVLGVLYAGAYLEDCQNADNWLYFGIQEVESCMSRQFFEDGTNFEGSTSYHRLSGEMMAWAALIILSVPKERISNLKTTKDWNYTPRLKKSTMTSIDSNEFLLSKSFWTKLIKATEFSSFIAKPTGEVCQFGDNDSGRFIHLTSFGESIPAKSAKKKYLNLKNLDESSIEDYWDENTLNHGAFISAVYGLLEKEPHQKHLCSIEFEIFKSITATKPNLSTFLNSLHTPIHQNEILGNPKTFGNFHKEKLFQFDETTHNFTKNNTAQYFKDFQLITIKNDSFYLALAGISNPKQHHSLGHTHNDKLAIELQINGQDILFNPGTYVYTPNPIARDLFRSVKSHNTISVNGEDQNTPLPGGFGLFNLKAETTFTLIKLTQTEIIAEVKYRTVVHQRRIEITQNSILVQDWCNHEFEQHWNTGKPYSNGYGKRLS